MAGPVLAFEFLFLFGCFGTSIILFVYTIYTIIKRRTLRRTKLTGILFLTMASISFYCYYGNEKEEYEDSRKFLGDYKLKFLDGQKCENCKVTLKDGFKYDIIVNGRVIGNGKWHNESATDIPGSFLELENGPKSVIWERDRLIDYIDRGKKSK